MTLIVGILCSDGVVVASDSSATYGSDGMSTIGQQSIPKVRVISETLIYASTGAVGMSQLIHGEIRDSWNAGAYKPLRSAEDYMDAVGKKILNKIAPYLQSAQILRQLVGSADGSLCKSLLAMPVGGKAHLFTFEYNGAPEEVSSEARFVSLGSGQPIADPFLAFMKRILWPDSLPSLQEGKLVASWAVRHVCATNPGGVGGQVQLATLTTKGGSAKARLVPEEDLAETEQKIADAEQSFMRAIRSPELEDAVSQPPEAP